MNPSRSVLETPSRKACCIQVIEPTVPGNSAASDAFEAVAMGREDAVRARKRHGLVTCFHIWADAKVRATAAQFGLTPVKLIWADAGPLSPARVSTSCIIIAIFEVLQYEYR